MDYLDKFTQKKIARLSFNSQNWRRPTGEARKQEAPDTYNHKNGFGHEDWLFRDEWTIAGWRYAFLQGVNKSLSKLVNAAAPLDVTLFTIQPDKRRRYVAVLRNVECLDERQAREALSIFKRRGWLDAMTKEIKDVGGEPNALGNVQWARHVLNVRFRRENVGLFPAESYARETEPVLHWNRYLLYDAEPDQPHHNSVSQSTRKGSEAPPNEISYIRAYECEVEVTPEHARMQENLMEQLAGEFPGCRVIREKNFIDVFVETETDQYLYEIKSDLSPLTVIRLAIGQLLEYAFLGTNNSNRALHLVVVGRIPLSDVAKRYLDHLRSIYSLPLEYRVVEL